MEGRRTTLVGEDANPKKLVGVDVKPKKLVGVGALETSFGGIVLELNGNVGKIGENVESCPNGRL